MRRALSLVFAIIAGAGVGVAAVRAAPALEGRWHSLDASPDASIADRLARSDRAPVLFIPDSVSREPSQAATLVVTLPGLGGVGRDLATEFVGAAEVHRWLLLAPSPAYDPLHGESLESADLRVDD